MSIHITSKKQQAFGSFNNGSILENKPIGFPQDEGEQKPYSNLFYWANAYTSSGGLIDLHPHKFFEIMTFVLEGEVNHYDTKNKTWFSLTKGDAQIIRAGKGISHSEKLLPNSRIFQIWFDPNIKETMNNEASYNDYKLIEFPIEKIENGTTVKYVGKKGKIDMDAEGVEISMYNIKRGNNSILLDADKIHSFYLVVGNITINNNEIKENNFIKIEDEKSIQIDSKEEASLFLISTPKQLTYKTYNELVKF